MGDGKALQMGTSHELGQNFATAFGIQFANEEGQLAHPWQTSWGVSTRLIGALVMAHGDDFGLRLPPALAPLEVVVMVVRDGEGVDRAAEALAGELAAAGRRVRVDRRTDTGFGRRSVGWELKGVPVRVEVGPRDLEAGTVTVVVRHRRTKEQVPLSGAADRVREELERVPGELHAEAARFLADRTSQVEELAEAVTAAGEGFARIPWAAVGEDGERELAAAGLSVRCLTGPDGELLDGPDLEAAAVAVVGRAY